MNTQDKELLFKDLSMRLPYHVYIQAKGYSIPIELRHLSLDTIPNVKPYLKPMSSMTEEERKELSNYENPVQRTDFFYSHHIDCRFMIEKGLALEAPKDMYKTEQL